jgi:hypothetical protein
MAAALETINSQIFENIWQKVNVNLDKFSENNKELIILKPMAMGGSVAAEAAISTCPTITRYWGDGSEIIADELSLLFSLLMFGQIASKIKISRAYIWLKEQPPKELSGIAAQKDKALHLVQAFNGEIKRSMDDYQHFEQQLFFEQTNNTNMSGFSSLLLARVSEICGHKCINWDEISWPVANIAKLAESSIIDGTLINNEIDIKAMLMSVQTGAKATQSYYHTLAV